MLQDYEIRNMADIAGFNYESSLEIVAMIATVKHTSFRLYVNYKKAVTVYN